jgi:hypothetical protein
MPVVDVLAQLRRAANPPFRVPEYLTASRAPAQRRESRYRQHPSVGSCPSGSDETNVNPFLGLFFSKQLPVDPSKSK